MLLYSVTETVDIASR